MFMGLHSPSVGDFMSTAGSGLYKAHHIKLAAISCRSQTPEMRGCDGERSGKDREQ